jgi:hypothetical protein
MKKRTKLWSAPFPWEQRLEEHDRIAEKYVGRSVWCPASPNRERKLKTTFTTLAFAAVLAVAGCYLGDSVGATRAVAMKLPVSAQRNQVNVSTNQPEIQEAIKLIDEVLVANGYVRDQDPPSANDQGLVASYGYFCSAYVKDGKLTVSFLDYRQHHSSTRTKNVCKLLKDKLSSRYGADSVKVE